SGVGLSGPSGPSGSCTRAKVSHHTSSRCASFVRKNHKHSEQLGPVGPLGPRSIKWALLASLLISLSWDQLGPLRPIVLVKSTAHGAKRCRGFARTAKPLRTRIGNSHHAKVASKRAQRALQSDFEPCHLGPVTVKKKRSSRQ